MLGLTMVRRFAGIASLGEAAVLGALAGAASIVRLDTTLTRDRRTMWLLLSVAYLVGAAVLSVASIALLTSPRRGLGFRRAVAVWTAGALNVAIVAAMLIRSAWAATDPGSTVAPGLAAVAMSALLFSALGARAEGERGVDRAA
jgi:hypothetical protein